MSPKRKKTKKSNKKILQFKSNDNSKVKEPVPKQGITLKERLYLNNGEGISRVASWLPLFVGAWIFSGPFLKNLGVFSLIIAPLIGLTIIQKTDKNISFPFLNEFKALVYAGVILCSFGLFYITGNVPITIFTVLASLVLLFEIKLVTRDVKSTFIAAILKTLYPTILAQIGVLSQSVHLDSADLDSFSNLYIGYCILGIVPGSILGARELVLNYNKFLSEGWKRILEVNKKDGSVAERPGGFSRAVILFLIIGPSIPALLTPFGYFPVSFLIASLAFLVVPKIGENLQGDPDNYPQLAIHLGNLAFAMSIGMLIAGLTA